jgi:ATP adenylyltransferase
MKQIWSPWRMDYIMHHEHNQDCVFCKALQQSDGPENLILSRGKNAFVILNRYPYTSGHLMVVPFCHIALPELMDAATRIEVMDLLILSQQVLREVYHPEGFNLGANIGAAAGAGIAAHLHFHMVPRWAGDSNFMSTLANTRILPEKLEDTYRRLLEAWI